MSSPPASERLRPPRPPVDGGTLPKSWLLLLLVLACLAASPTPSSAVENPRTVRGAAHEVSQVSAVIAADREAVGWAEGSNKTVLFGSQERSESATRGKDDRGVFVAFRKRDGGGFGRPRRLAGAAATGFDLVAASNGSLLAAWVTMNRKLQIAWWQPGTGWTHPRTLGTRAARVSQGLRVSMALAPDGTGLISWRSGSLRKPAVVVAPVLGAGIVGRTVTLARGIEVAPARSPEVAAADGGRGIVVWAGRCLTDGSPVYPAMTADLLGGEITGTAAPIPNSECPNAGLDAHIDANGAAFVLINGLLGEGQIRVAVRLSSASAFPSASRISGEVSSNFGSLVGSPTIAVWSTSAGSKQTVELVRSGQTGDFSAPEEVGRVRSPVDVAESSSGDAIATWQLPPPSLRISATPLCSDGRVGPPIAVSGRLRRQTAALPAIAVEGTRAIVAWGVPTRHGRYRGVEATSFPNAC